jgi:hypothetical protein
LTATDGTDETSLAFQRRRLPLVWTSSGLAIA